jgi:hypothetical protein
MAARRGGYAEQYFRSLGAGLNLRDKVDAVSEAECIDALNVMFTDRGTVEQRDGYTALTSALTNAAATLHPYYTTGGTVQIVAGCGTRLEGISTGGTVVASATGLTDGIWDFARFGTPGNEYIYAGQGSGNLRRWNGSTWTDLGASSPEAGALCVTPVSSRLVAARFNGATGGPAGTTTNPSYVHFSDAGAPETWTANNYIQITPGDGEKVQAVVTWGTYVFIFKETKFAVYYGESTDSSGNPIFNYRMVDAGVGALGPKAVVAGTDGVYFAGRAGVYRTQGGPPELLSDIIDPIFDSTATVSDYFLGGTMLQSQASNTALAWHNDRLYVSYTSTGTANNYTLVYDPEQNWWTLTDIPAAHAISFRRSNTPELLFCDTTGKKLYYSNPSLTSDNGTAITSRWRSGWFDYGEGARKRIRESKVWGSGQPFMGISTDFDPALSGASQLTFGETTVTGDTWGGTTWGGGSWTTVIDSPIAPGLYRTSAVGSVFSTWFSNSILNQPWSVHRVTHHVASKRIPTVIT